MRFTLSWGLVPLTFATAFAATINKPQDAATVLEARDDGIKQLNMWPYNETVHAAIPEVILAPLNHPKISADCISPLEPKAKHLLWFADSNAAIEHGQRNVSAALLVKTKTPVVNLGASNLVTDIECSTSKEKNKSSLKVYFKSKENANAAMKLWWGSTKPKGGYHRQTFMDAYGSGCGKPDVLQFFQQCFDRVRAPVREKNGDWTLTINYKEIPETEVVTDFRLGWGDEHQKCLNSHTGKYARQVDDLEAMFEGDWPKTADVPMTAHAALKRRGLSWGGYTWDKKYDIDFRLKDDTTVWGPGKNLWTDDKLGLSVACVGCGINGTVATSGSISWSLFKGVTGAKAYVSQSTLAQIAIGVSASAEYATHGTDGNPMSAEIKKTFTYPLSPFTLGGFLTAGPSISLEPFVQGQLKTTGKMLIGGGLHWDNANAQIDLMDIKDPSKNTKENWAPTPKAIFDLEAEISAEARAGVRFSLDFGVSITVGSGWKKGVSVTEEPSIYAKAGAGLSAYLDPNGELKTDLTSPTDRSCEGVNFEIGFNNKLYATVDIIGRQDYDLWKIDPVKIWGHCWQYKEMTSWLSKEDPECGFGQSCFRKGKPVDKPTSVVPEIVASETATPALIEPTPAMETASPMETADVEIEEPTPEAVETTTPEEVEIPSEVSSPSEVSMPAEATPAPIVAPGAPGAITNPNYKKVNNKNINSHKKANNNKKINSHKKAKKNNRKKNKGNRGRRGGHRDNRKWN